MVLIEARPFSKFKKDIMKHLNTLKLAIQAARNAVADSPIFKGKPAEAKSLANLDDQLEMVDSLNKAQAYLQALRLFLLTKLLADTLAPMQLQVWGLELTILPGAKMEAIRLLLAAATAATKQNDSDLNCRITSQVEKIGPFIATLSDLRSLLLETARLLESHEDKEVAGQGESISAFAKQI